MKKAALTIAGLDPSGGAGLFADVKTFEAFDVMGLGVCSALTVQNQDTFKSVGWIEPQYIAEQASLLFSRYRIGCVKIGLIESLDALDSVIDSIKGFGCDAPIVWDPILMASSGYVFHDGFDSKKLKQVFSKLHLAIPNAEEAMILAGIDDFMEAGLSLARSCKILLKGGHLNEDPVLDRLFSGNTRLDFEGVRAKGKVLHGSGCVFASAIVANLAIGLSIEQAIGEARKYMDVYFEQNNA